MVSAVPGERRGEDGCRAAEGSFGGFRGGTQQHRLPGENNRDPGGDQVKITGGPEGAR